MATSNNYPNRTVFRRDERSHSFIHSPIIGPLLTVMTKSNFPFLFGSKATDENNPDMDYKSMNGDGKGADSIGTVQKKKHHLLTIHDINEKFVRSNLIWIFVGTVLYVGIGIAIYHNMMEWDRLECLFFLTTTLLTIGYGDYVPITESERVFTAFYILLGILIFGSAVGSMSTFVQAHEEKMAKKRNLRALIRMKDENGPGKSEVVDSASTLAAVDQSQSTSSSSTKKGDSRRRSLLQMAISFREAAPQKKTLQEMREASVSAYADDYRALVRSSIIDVVSIFLVLIFGMIVMSEIEGWSAGEGFYWSVVTIMTVGYGDLVPKTTSGKWVTIFYALIGCIIVAKALTDCAKYPLLARMMSNELTVINQFASQDALTPQLLQQIFSNELHELIPDLKRNPNEMSKGEFVMVILQMMNKVEEKDILLAAKIFDDLDTNNKGYFSMEDMIEQVQSARVRADTMAEAELRRKDSLRDVSPSPFQQIRKGFAASGEDVVFAPFQSMRSSWTATRSSLSGKQQDQEPKSAARTRTQSQIPYVPPPASPVLAIIDSDKKTVPGKTAIPPKKKSALLGLGFESISDDDNISSTNTGDANL
jgi:hypothetical protein